MGKTLLVGLDAACWEYLRPLLEAGRLPVVQSLMAGGTWGTLRSTSPPWTPTAWATLATGKNPEKHGIFDMVWREPGSYGFKPVNSSMRQGTPFWKRLNEEGLRVGLVNVPFTYPPEPIDGFTVVGFGTPERANALVEPAASHQLILDIFGDYKPVVDAKLLETGKPADILAAEKAHQARQVDVALALAAHHDVQVLVINLMLTDHANHKMPNLAEVQTAYEYADQDLGRLLSGFAPDNVLLISDHGSSRLKGEFLLDVWLKDNGLVTFARRNRKDRDDALNWVLLQWLQRYLGWSGWTEKAARGLLRVTLTLLPSLPIWRYIERAIPLAREHVNYEDQPDFAGSAVFPGSAYSGLLYLNVDGREPQGVIPAAERADFVSEIARRLRRIAVPDTGTSLFREVLVTEKDGGDTANGAPDLILDTDDGVWAVRAKRHVPAPGGTVRNRYFLENAGGADFGWHSREGVFVFCGSAFEAGRSDLAASLADIPATVLHLHGAAVPDDFDGSVLTELFTDPWRNEPVRRQAADPPIEGMGESLFVDEQAEEVMAHLRALGYLE